MLCPYRSVPACRAPGGGRYLHAPGPPLSALEYAQYARWYRPCVKVCLYFALFLSLSLCFFHTHSPTHTLVCIIFISRYSDEDTKAIEAVYPTNDLAYRLTKG